MFVFKGGVHPKDEKSITSDKAIVTIKELPDEMVYPLNQHLGALAKAVVNVGDDVKIGQVIAEASTLISADVLSSVSGKVKAIEKRLDIMGNMTDSIIVTNDHEERTIDGFGKDRDLDSLSREEIIDIVKKAGIVGLGGAGFPTYVKLSTKNFDEIDYVIINGAECEPYLTSDYRLMVEQADKIILGLRVYKKLFPKAKCVIAIEDNKPLAIKTLIDLAKGEKFVEVKALHTKYPQGGERQLIYSITGRKLNYQTLPAQKGCIVDNIDTTVSVYNAVYKRIPLLRRIMTLSGYCFNNPGNYEVRLGMTYAYLIDKVGGFSKKPKKIVSGGPMMGLCIYDLNVPIAKNSSGVLTFDVDYVEQPQTHCINCGKCVNACPERLIPSHLANYAENYDYEGFNKLYGMECIECGSCAYVCPAKRPLTQYFKIMKRKTGAYLKEKAQKEVKNKVEENVETKGGKA